VGTVLIDNTVPWVIANASYKQQKRNPTVTEIIKMPNRGHAGHPQPAGVRSRTRLSHS